MMNRCFGRKPHDPIAVNAAPELADHYSVVSPPPKTLLRTGINFQPQLSGNDNYPTCVVAGLINGALASEAIATNGPLNIDPMAWMKFYAYCAGIAETPAAIGASDGLQMLDVLKKQAAPPGFDIGAIAPLIGGFGTVALDRISLARAAAAMDFVYLGVLLSQADMDAPTGAAWPNGVGDPNMGHCVVIWGYTGLGDTDTVWVATWGYLQAVTWLWIEARSEEAFATFFPMTAAAGVNTVDLAAENAQWLTS
jgi:hypothetical protein